MRVRKSWLDTRRSKGAMMCTLLLCRGRDRLETRLLRASDRAALALLLCRGRDRLETSFEHIMLVSGRFSYSVGDAIDWKPKNSKHFC